MGHFHSKPQKVQMGTDKPWLEHASQITEVVNKWADRKDLIAYVASDAGRGVAPALFDPRTAEIEVNTDIAFGTGVIPDFIGDMRKRSTQFDFPAATGAVLHEAMHAKHTSFDLDHVSETLEPMEARALINILEESRIEGLGVKEFPKNRAFLRACALGIVLDSMESKPDDEAEAEASLSPTRQYSQLAGLVMGRVDAGVLEESDVKKSYALIKKNLPGELIRALRALWLRFQVLDPMKSRDEMYDIAREWVRLVEEQAEANGEPMPSDIAEAIASGESGEGEGSEGASQAIADALGEDNDTAQGNAQDEGYRQQGDERREAEAAAREAEGKEKTGNKETAEKVFGRGTGPGPAHTNSALVETREPKPAERAAAMQIAREIEKAQYIERSKTEIHSYMPPGRLRTRSMVQGIAAKSQGRYVETEDWRRTKRTHNDSPPLSIGIMVDISGSMGGAMEPMAVTAYVVSEATRQAEATGAIVYYGNDVFSTLRPGEHLDKVKVYSAPDGTEKFNQAFKALDGSLNLLWGKGARLLVVVSDGYYTPEEVKAVKHWLKRCYEQNVAVLWLGMASGYRDDPAKDYCDPKKGQMYFQVGSNVTDAALRIGRHAADMITQIGKQIQ